MYPTITDIEPCLGKRDRQVPRVRQVQVQDKEGRAGQGKYTMCMTQPHIDRRKWLGT